MLVGTILSCLLLPAAFQLLYVAAAQAQGTEAAPSAKAQIPQIDHTARRLRPSGAAAGDTVRMSLGDVRALTFRQNPGLLAARLDTVVARGELRQAGVLRFNPSADALSAGGGNGPEFGVSQEIELFGQSGARRAAGRAGLVRARAGAADAARLTIAEVDRAFYRLVWALRRTDLANEVLGLNQRLADVVARQLEAGDVSRLNYNLAVVELGRSRSRALATRREREQVGVDLGRLAGLPRGTVILPLVDSLWPERALDSAAAVSLAAAPAPTHPPRLDLDSLTAVALARRPDLAEREAAARQAAAQATVARREALPNLVIRGTSQRERGAERAFRPGVGLTLPIFNRNQGAAEARQAAAQQAEQERVALVARVRADLAAAVASYESAASEVEVLRSTVLAPARQNRQLLETAYREGKIGLPEILLIRNQAIDAELDYWSAWLAEREALAVVAEVTGQNLPDTTIGFPR